MKEFIRLTDEVNLKEVNCKKQIFLFIHGWTESRNKTWYEELKNALLEKFDVNIVQVDYSKPANQRYPVAVFSSKSIGKKRKNINTTLNDFFISTKNHQIYPTNTKR